MSNDQLLSIVARIERLEEEKRTISDDIKEVYAEAKANGYDVKILKKAVALRRRDANERAEEEAILDLYMQALGELADTPLGRAAAPGFSSSRQPMARAVPAYPERVSRPVQEQGPSGGEAGSAVRSGAPISETVTTATSSSVQSEAEAGSNPEEKAAAETGCGGVDLQTVDAASFVTLTGTGEGLAGPADPAPAAEAKPRFILPPAKAMRPHCLKPEACAGVGAKHCFPCTQAADEARQPAYEEA
jgi:uncharacterized protein (UPF0335 family)